MNIAIATARGIAAAHKDVPGGLLPALHGIQDALGHVPADAVPAIADEFNLSRAEVHGVISYYHHFRATPAARHVIHICRAEACQAMGADALVAHARKHLGCELHGHSRDGEFTLEPAYCLGLCASSPALLMDDELHARVTPQAFDELVAVARSAA
ncbi:formate dehydrogenase subunit gamma [Ramlibacter sp. WS9]|uniref:formate dehydrogenase subunit gamma n=1 Tax=Ramlibacter sp. WS9 TaxID=1882741 RepID=UPI001144D587|nr:formate dehydrogenase subunit gamma [Ramlibacter sp. WS9]ROZ76588.1 formate dehydrogenase subunit gamma [Ramlibacter sp. WS9]